MNDMFVVDAGKRVQEVSPSAGSALGVPTGAGNNGTTDLTSANTWTQVPSTVPTKPYILVATIPQSAIGTNIVWAYSNVGTPSTSVGCPMPGSLAIELKGGDFIYIASSTAGDDITWTTKEF